MLLIVELLMLSLFKLKELHYIEIKVPDCLDFNDKCYLNGLLNNLSKISLTKCLYLEGIKILQNLCMYYFG